MRSERDGAMCVALYTCFYMAFTFESFFSQKIGELNESNAALRERLELLHKEKVRCVICMEIYVKL